MRERNHALDVIKILACFLVIMNHSSWGFSHYPGVTPSWLLATLTFYVAKVAVPLFAMVTGALLFTRERDYAYSWHKVRKFFGILVIWDYAYWVYRIDGQGWWRVDLFLRDFIEHPATVHLWYLYMLVAFYLMLPLLSRLLATFKRRDYHYFLLLWLLFGTAVPFLGAVTDVHLSPYFQLPLFTGFIGFFVLGRYLAEYRLSPGLMVISGLVGLLSITAATVYRSAQAGHVFMGFDNVVFLPIVLIAASLFSLIAHTYQRPPAPGFITGLSQLTFGIYLTHYYWLDTIRKWPVMQRLFATGGVESYLTYLLVDLAVFIGCAGITWLLQRTKYTRWLVS